MENIKEKRIKEILLAYYSRKDIRKAIFDFSQNRECVPRYFEGFGKRPDSFQYESDIFEHVKRGATSFHCSEEIWEDPLEISTNMSINQLNELRIGWDLLLDVDSPYLEYSKIYTDLLIKTLKFHGIKNLGVKFSGNKGFHIIIPWKAFPKEIYGQKTREMFPEWPRIICNYLTETIQPKLAEEIYHGNLKEIAKRTGKKEEELLIKQCSLCNNPAIKKFLITWYCPYCKNEVTRINGKALKCPNDDCRKPLIEKSRKEIFVCEYCNVNSFKNPEAFKQKERFATEKLIEADLILVSSRHLFRMPYSLHEKTSLSSVVLNPENILNFQIKDAKPFKIKVKNFLPNAEENEAKNLLLQALDWNEQKNKPSKSVIKKEKNKNKDYKKVIIKNPSKEIFPPCIRLLLQGVKDDGRKRALFLLINFFTSLNISEEEIENYIYEWNKKNYNPLKEGYIKSQLTWHFRNESRLPPNCDKPNYKELNVCHPDNLCKIIKNPVSYSIKKFFNKG